MHNQCISSERENGNSVVRVGFNSPHHFLSVSINQLSRGFFSGLGIRKRQVNALKNLLGRYAEKVVYSLLGYV